MWKTLLLSLIIAVLAYRINNFNNNITVSNSSFSCKQHKLFFNSSHTIRGSEDAALDRQSGMLYVSLLDFKLFIGNGIQGLGVIYRYDTNTGEGVKLKLLNVKDYKFNPHGLAFYKEDASKYLFIINHAPDGDQVDIFRILERDNVLQLHKSYQFDSMMSLNDVTPVSLDSFYATSDHYVPKFMKNNLSLFSRNIINILSDLVGLKLSSVMHVHHGQDKGLVAKFLTYANGIYFDSGNSILYVSETTGKSLKVFDVDDNGELTLINKFEFPSFLDNIDADEDGTLWIAAHPNIFLVARALESPDHHHSILSPSQEFKFVPKISEDRKISV